MPQIQPYSAEAQSNATDILQKHAPLVKRIAHHLLARLPDHVQLDDLVQAGLEGLLEAANNFEYDRGASFETYAGIRIRGAMLDEVRRGDWSPRSVYRNARRIAEVYSRLESTLSRTPTDAEMAEALEVEIVEYQTMARHSLCAKLSSLDESISDEQSSSKIDTVASSMPGPEQLVQDEDLKERLIEAINELPERDRLLLNLYYFEELNLKEIGKILGVSESRVSQLNSQAAIKLRAKLIE